MATPLKKLPKYRGLRSGLETSPWSLQPTDFVGLTFSIRARGNGHAYQGLVSPTQAGQESRLEETTMRSTFDVFKVLRDGPLWVSAAQSLREAEERMARFVLVSPGDYFIRSEQEVVVAIQSQEWAEVI